MNDLYHFFKDVSERSNSEIIETQSLPLESVQKYIVSKYISPGIRESIITLSDGVCYTFEDFDVEVCIFGSHKDVNVTRILETIRFILTMNGHTEELKTMVIFLTPLKKELSDSFTPDNVNSGLTNGRFICIFREEEVVKVCIHELIHALDWDFGKNESKIQLIINDTLDLSGDFSLTEAYTEAWAKIINCYICSESLTEFKKNIKTERNFSQWQMSKVIVNSKNRDNMSDFISDIDSETHVFSYYILAPAMIYDTDKFIRFCGKHNKDYAMFQNESEEFSQLIAESLVDPKFLKSLKKMISVYKKNKDKKGLLNKTMRMTVIEC